MAEVAETKSEEILSQDTKMWGMLCHLTALAGFVIPFGNIIGPVVIWILKKEEHPFIDEQGKESLNFQISMSIYLIASIILIFVIIGIPLLIGLGIFNLIVIIIAALKANNGEHYHYPLSITFLH